MKLHDGYNVGVADNNGDVTLSTHNGFFDKCIRFYSRKFHFVIVPIVIIISAIHLKYGIQYLDQCTIQPMINIYMIVQASAALFLILLAMIGMIVVRCIYSDSEKTNHKIIGQSLILIVVILSLIVGLFSFAWLVAGSVWVFGAKSNGVQGSDPTITATYCQSDLYRAAFALIIINYVVHTVIILILIVRHMCFKRDDTVPPHAIARDRV